MIHSLSTMIQSAAIAVEGRRGRLALAGMAGLLTLGAVLAPSSAVASTATSSTQGNAFVTTYCKPFGGDGFGALEISLISLPVNGGRNLSARNRP